MLPGALNGQTNGGQPSSLQSALQMQEQQGQQQGGGMSPGGPKRRRRAEEEGSGGAEPRRLRRSHEACARCRSKKIKCDSKHPRCTACATAGTTCNQEDRHRQRLTPRGLTIHMEQMLAQCEALLKTFIPEFQINRLEEFLVRQNIDPNSINAASLTADFQQSEVAPARSFQMDPNAPPAQQQSPKSFPQVYTGPPIMPPYAAHPHMLPYPPGAYPPILHGPPPMYPAFHPPPGFAPPPGHPPPGHVPPPPAQAAPPLPTATTTALSPRQVPAKGTDPNGNNMSEEETLAKNFGVSPNIVGDYRLIVSDREDLAVGYNGLTSGRDRTFHESAKPRHPHHWISLAIPRNGSVPNTLALPPQPHSPPTTGTVTVWLPKDRVFLKQIVDVYFLRLNIHRPVYSRKEFDKIVNDMYEQSTSAHDPGHICGVYLVLALGTLSELNHRAVKADVENKSDAKTISSVTKDLMPGDWPEHDEFFERALAVKPDLRVSVSSLQALILLHWYLYTERQGRTLWRLVGSLVRLSIELGLHHDPSTQYVPSPQGPHVPMVPLFSDEECQLRIRLWGIVLVHDRGTSILLGRPLAISPSDTNTPRPSRNKGRFDEFSSFSEHFELSHPVAEIQADIINSLYTPKRQAGDTVMRNATRIIKSMVEFRRGLPERYRFYFNGTKDWPLDKKSKLVQEITEDEGLTLLKLGIARILLLRALFSSKELSYPSRHQALVDAIITSHNIIVIHHQLIRFPDIAFFTSPIPLHIAAMVILFGHMSECDILPRQTALEDLWMALDMIPRFRWRWERKDSAGGHPLIARLVERVMSVDLHTIGPTSHPILICEPDWDEDGSGMLPNSPRGSMKQQNTPPVSNATYGPGSGSGQGVGGGVNGAGTNGGPPGGIGGPGQHPHGAHGQGSVSGPGYPGVVRSMNGGGIGSGASGVAGANGTAATSPHQRLVDMPPNLFYPFYPEAPVSHDVLSNGGPPPASASTGSGQGQGVIQGPGQNGADASGPGGPGHQHGAGGHGGQPPQSQDYSHLLASVAAAQGGSYNQPGQNTYMSEERPPEDPPQNLQGVPGQGTGGVWMGHMPWRGR